MPFHEKFDILAFRSRQHAFHFSQILRDHGIASQIMSTPKEILLGCGLSLRFSPYMRERVLRIYKQYNSPITGCYHVERVRSESKITRIPI
jgi:hypothetical protein